MKMTIRKSVIIALSAAVLTGCASSNGSVSEEAATTAAVTEEGGTDTVETAATTESVAEPETETIELTSDNWQDYLELKEVFAPEYNDFEEVEGIEDIYVLALKDGMSFAENSNPEVAIEYEYDWNYYALGDVDFENFNIEYIPVEDAKRQELGREIVHGSDTTTLYSLESLGLENALGGINKAWTHLEDGEQKVYGPGGTISGTLNDGTEFWWCIVTDNVSVSRIKGTIEIVKDQTEENDSASAEAAATSD